MYITRSRTFPAQRSIDGLSLSAIQMNIDSKCCIKNKETLDSPIVIIQRFRMRLEIFTNVLLDQNQSSRIISSVMVTFRLCSFILSFTEFFMWDILAILLNSHRSSCLLLVFNPVNLELPT